MDKRIVNTKASLKKGLFELVRNKAIERITVKELCEQAHVNRSTFYAYYKSPEDLLEEVLNELYARFEEAAKGGEEDGTYLKMMLTVAQENKLFVSVMMSNKVFGEWVRNVFYMLENRIMEEWNKKYGYDFETSKAAYDFAVGGAARMIEVWIGSGFKSSPEEIAMRIKLFTEKGISALE